jgi:cathepsin L
MFAFIACCSTMTIFDSKLDRVWNQFKTFHTKAYETKAQESYRRMIWERNLKKIEAHNNEANQGKHTYRQKMNKFGDLVSQVFIQLLVIIKFLFKIL